MLSFGLFGSMMMWLLLRWLQKPANFMALILGGGSWVLAGIVGHFQAMAIAPYFHKFLGSVPIINVLWVLVLGSSLGAIVTIGFRIGLRKAGVRLMTKFAMLTGTCWGISFVAPDLAFLLPYLGVEEPAQNRFFGFNVPTSVFWARVVVHPLAGVLGFAVLTAALSDEAVHSPKAQSAT